MNATSSRARVTASDPLAPKRQRAKRMPAEARKAVILREAADFFARHGFTASTRDLADQIGVRQALLYKYYPSKEALIEAIFDALIKERDVGGYGRLSEDRSISLEERIVAYYDFLLRSFGGSASNLTLRAAIDDLPAMTRLSNFASVSFINPLIEELRGVESLPSLAERSLMPGEMEIVLALHAIARFADMRRNASNQVSPTDAEASLRFLIATFLPAARAGVRELHAGKAPASLTTAR
jgi:AcrR family transcriptional regulator